MKISILLFFFCFNIFSQEYVLKNLTAQTPTNGYSAFKSSREIVALNTRQETGFNAAWNEDSDNPNFNKEQIAEVENNLQEFKRDEVEQALNSDFVFIGLVENIKETPGKKNEMFHSMVVIHVDTILRGKTSFENIIIMLQSGPVTDLRHGGVRIKVSSEPNFRIGQRIVLFLKNARNDPYLNSEHAKEKYKSYGNKNAISDLPENTFWASNKQVFEIKNGLISYFNKIIKESDFIKNIKNIQGCQ